MAYTPSEEAHRTLTARAAEAGMSLSEYLLQDPTDEPDRLTMKEMIGLIRSRPRVDLGDISAAGIIREERDFRSDRPLPGL